MLHHKNRLIAKIARVVFWSATVCNTFCAIWGKLPERDAAHVVYAWFRDVGNAYSAFLVLVFSLLVAVSGIALKRYGSLAMWETLHELISGLRSAVFKGTGYENPDHHKVTIFRIQSTCSTERWYCRLWFAFFPSKKRWLVPVARSHHMSQTTKTCFSLSDDSAKCAGVAGQAYACNRVVAIAGLPDVAGSPSVKEVKAYSSEAFVSKEWVQNKKPKARSILAMPLRVGGEAWGVLVFDSRLPEKIKYDELADIFEVIQKHINRLLTKHL